MYIQKEIHKFRPALNSRFGVKYFSHGFDGVFAHMQLAAIIDRVFPLMRRALIFTLAPVSFSVILNAQISPRLFLSRHFSNRGQVGMFLSRVGQPCM